MKGGQSARPDHKTARARAKELCAGDHSMLVKNSDENPLMEFFDHGYFKGKVRELLHNPKHWE